MAPLRIIMIKQSCLFARGLTTAYTGSVGNGSEEQVDAGTTPDDSRYTSLVVDGHTTGYICGYGSTLMNGQFVRPGAIATIPNQGWVGNFSNTNFNNIGVLRHVMTNIAYAANITNGSTWLIISDEASVSNTTDYGHWGQFVQYLKRRDVNFVAHPWQEVNSGAYGYQGDQKFYHQWAGVILLLSSASQTMPTAFNQILTQAIKNGVSFVVIQKGAGQGGTNFNSIFNSMGIGTANGALTLATAASKNRQVALYGNHISWTNVIKLHIQWMYRNSDTYRLTNVSGTADSMSGQPGAWKRFFCANVDIVDDTVLDPEVIIRDNCCVVDGTGYNVKFDITSMPYKPDSWLAFLAAGTHSVAWKNDSDKSLRDRSYIFSHVVGYGVAGSDEVSYTVLNGIQYRDGDRGITVYVINKSDRLLRDRRSFDLKAEDGNPAGIANANACAAFLNSFGDDVWIMCTMYDEMKYNRMAGNLPAAMYRIGASRRVYGSSAFKYRGAYNVLGSPGVGEGNAINETYLGDIDSDPHAVFDIGYSFDRLGNPYTTGCQSSGLSMQITGLAENTKTAHIEYYKVIHSPDAGKTYGVNHDILFRDHRFKKLPMYDEDSSVVSVTNPCMPVPIVASHDWVRVVALSPGQQTVYYPFKDGYEYLVMSTDDSGPPEMCTSHFMMNWEMFTGVGTATMYNQAGIDHLIHCGSSTGNKNNPASLYFQGTGSSRIWQIYERRYGLTSAVPGRDTNDWQVIWKWSGAGSQGHNIQIAAGYEYIMFAYDRYGDLELAERHFFVPKAANLPKWGANLYTHDFSNSTTFTVNRALVADAFCTTNANSGNQNGIMMIMRRPLFDSIGLDDRTGWQLVLDRNGTSMPGGANYSFPLAKNYQYMIMASASDGSIGSYHINAWNRVWDAAGAGWNNASLGATSLGWVGFLYDGSSINVTGITTNGATYESARAQSVFQIYRRPIYAWEPYELE
ncbi:hypothetical protein fHeYen902_329c [Yersinia phage fHe-Yen9-02]|nr:hypothetical protein fHeYen902_329c [Yersinia phage fHe-Yen9-02]